MEFIEIYAPAKRLKKVKIARDEYEAVHQLILSVLATGDEVSLSSLMEIGEEQLGVQYINLSWLIILIKNDMAYRKLIDVIIDPERNQLLKLKRRKRYG